MDGYDGGADGSGDESTDDGHPSPDRGSDVPATARAASVLGDLGNSLNPISTAHAAGTGEEIGTAATRSELAPTRVFFEPPLPRFAPVLPTLPVTPGQPFSPPASSSPSQPVRTPRSGSTTRQERVQGHPDLHGSVRTFSSDHTGDVTLRLQGVNGIWGADIGTYDMDAEGNFRDGGQDPVLGTVRPDGIHLTREGEAKLAPDLAGRTPPAAADSPPAETPQQRGFVHDMPRDREEERIVSEMTAWGASAEEIQAALDTYRRNQGNQGSTGNAKPPAGAGLAVAPLVPTPRDGVIGGKPTGIRNQIPAPARKRTEV